MRTNQRMNNATKCEDPFNALVHRFGHTGECVRARARIVSISVACVCVCVAVSFKERTRHAETFHLDFPTNAQIKADTPKTENSNLIYRSLSVRRRSFHETSVQLLCILFASSDPLQLLHNCASATLMQRAYILMNGS